MKGFSLPNPGFEELADKVKTTKLTGFRYPDNFGPVS